ncbi:MAG: flagellar basal body rod protein FlgB [Acetobacterales bacterium]
MDLRNLTLFRMSEQRMDYLNERQKVLSTNIANADSPSYRPRDLKEQQFRSLVREAQSPRIAFEQTDAGHIQSASLREPDMRDRKDKVSYESAPAGNAVVIEEQMIKVGETSLQYDTTSRLYRKYLEMFKTALGADGLG